MNFTLSLKMPTVSKEEYEKEWKSILAEKARLDEITKTTFFKKKHYLENF